MLAIQLPKRTLCVSFGWKTGKAAVKKALGEVFDTFLGYFNLKCPQIERIRSHVNVAVVYMCGFLNYST